MVAPWKQISICILLLSSGICGNGSCAEGEPEDGARMVAEVMPEDGARMVAEVMPEDGVRLSWDKPGEEMTSSRHPGQIQGWVQCGICKFVIGKLLEATGHAHKDMTKEKIVEKLKGICPNWVKRECHDFIEKYEKQLVNTFLHVHDPRKACISMDFCKPSRRAGNAL
ncbi:prosaposin-like isoform X1 [Engraulis encrasicolus]|uniref:prosaposin-like isoform X1 n=1 Tax=Engraulis encrasicolus TaxID=184585 RepID=UPI002FD35AB3